MLLISGSRGIAFVALFCWIDGCGPGMAQTAETNPPPPTASSRLEPLEHFSRFLAPYEPIYFLMGPEAPAVKFQLSFKCLPIDKLADFWIQPAFAYTQTSFWDIFGPSAPFYDTSYKPTAFVFLPDIFRQTNTWHLDLQSGYQHESNGRGGSDSRSMNMLYVQPCLRFGDPARAHVNITARAWVYIMDLSDNPDIAQYRGYANAGIKGGYEKYEFAARIQMGDTGGHLGLQLDFTAPLLRRYHFTPYFHIQYFNGFGETLLGYNQRTESIRFGLSLYE